MQIFELHFNPKFREGQIFDSFIYEPENIYEKNLGSLWMVGELQNTLPQNSKFLGNLAQLIKKNYYILSVKSPEKALSESLKKTNEFLAEEVKRDNVSWLGNLNFAVLSLKDSNLTFTKTGDLKILLIRAGQITDLSKNLDLEEIEPYPLKIFFNVVSGKLIQDDIILVLTKEIFEFFQQENLLARIAQAEYFGEQKLKEILPSSLFKKESSKISGICFLAIIKTESEKAKRVREILSRKKEKFSFSQILPNFSLKNLGGQVFSPLLKPITSISNKIKKTRKKGLFSLLKLPRFKIQLPKVLKKKKLKRGITIPKIKLPTIKKGLILALILFLLLFLGFLIFKRTEEKKEIGIKTSLNEIQEKVNQAETFLIFKNDEKANALFQEAWEEILPLIETKTSLKPDALSLKQSIEKNLEDLNKLERIENPEVATEFDPASFSLPRPPVNPPPFEFNLDLFAAYSSNLYFLDKKDCRIIKYPHLEGSNWGLPKIWKEADDNCFGPKSMAIDGSVWILNADNSVIRYHTGVYQETLNLNFFPFPENITKIETKPNLPYLYFLEPIKKRIIIIDKTGKIVKQFQSEKFDNLKDFSISENGKTIWLLNNLKVYQIKL